MRLGMGKQNHFRSFVFAVAWIDLLGYGSMLQKCNFDPTSQSAKNAVRSTLMFRNTINFQTVI